MKKILIVLSMLLAMMVMGCPNDDKKEETNEEDGRTVASEYRGTYVRGQVAYEFTENEFIWWNDYGNQLAQSVSYRWPAWTVNNELWVKGRLREFVDNAPVGETEFKLGHFDSNIFTNDATTNNNFRTYTRE
jgi:hypothetical protein